MDKEISISESENYTVLSSRVPSEVKEKVERFASKTLRSVSSSVHYLLETHPDLQDTTKQSIVLSK